ncbi:MAG: NADH-quinone oxidoreductase subunit K [Deltaproteobacteria bacterium]|nr:NADH-quinone oxidoreductase subunit K [Deltaproteobacteria bacterium]
MSLMLVGFMGLVWKRNLIKMVLAFTLIDTGAHLFLVALGYLPGATAPIVDDAGMFAQAQSLMVRQGAVVDPVVQALVLTAIVIGVGVTALMLSYVVRIYARRGTLDIAELRRLKW